MNRTAQKFLYGWLLALAWVAMCATPAQAQIAFRAAASAISAAGSGSGSAIGFVAAGTQTVGTGASITPAIPGGTSAGDFAVLIVAGRPTDTSTPTAPTGWTLRSSSLIEVGANDLKIVTYYRVLAGGDADPVISLPAGWQGAAAGMSGQIAVWSGVDTTTPFDVADVTGSTALVDRWTPPAITTVTDGAWAVSAVATSDDNDIDVRNANGFTGRMTRTNYDTTTGGDHAMALADENQATAGLVSMIEWRERSNGGGPNDPWVSITFALRPAAVPPDGLTINVPTGTTVGDVMVASIVIRPCSNTSGGACTVTITPPAGWTQVGATINQTTGGGTGGFGNRLAVYQRVVTGVEPANYTWTFGGTPVHAGAAGGISTFSGVDNTTPVDVQLGQATAGTATHQANSITTTVANTMLVGTFTANSGNTWSPPGGMTEAVDRSSMTAPDALGISLEMTYEARAAVGATAARSATPANPPAGDTGATFLLALRPGSSLDHFSISHAGSGVACDTQTITITAHNASHAAVSAGGIALSLSTSNGKGTWTGIVSGTGTLSDPVAGDGAATYTFGAGESSVQLSFRYANLSATSETFSFNVSGGGFTEASGSATAGSDDPSFTMAQAGFQFRNATDANTTIPTQISGKPSNTGFNAKTINIRAIRTDTATGTCTGLFASQTRTVDIGAECNSPSTCAGQVVTINATNVATSADNAGTGAAAYTGVSLTFDANSEAPAVITYPDAGQLSLHARYDLDTGVAGFEMLGSSNLFVVRPFGLALRGANSATAVQHGTTNTATLLAAAGDNFTMTVSAYRWAAGEDSNNDGVPDAGVNITDNGGVPNFAATATVQPTVNLPGIALGALSRGATCASAASVLLAGGSFTATDWCYSEVGNVMLQADVSNYITAGINITGNSGLDGTGAAGGYVGRFRPKKFAVSGATRTNRTLASCPSASSFSYMDEGLTLAFTLTAQNTQSAQTLNYTGSYARHDPTTGGSNNAKTAYGLAARNVSPFTDLTARVTGAYVSTAPAWSNGVLNVTGTNAALVTVGRSTPDDPPNGPYAQVQLAIAPTDADGVLMAAYDIDVDNAGGNDHTLTAATTEIRYGRLRLGAASGSNLLPLRVPVEAQYWNGTFFITNTDDSCTPLVTGNVGLGNPIGIVTADTSVTAVSSRLASGRGAITLAAPGNTKRGSVDVAVNLSAAAATADACPAFAPAATAANKSYLRGKWCGTTATKDPSTRARFGIQRGSDETIYTRENF